MGETRGARDRVTYLFVINSFGAGGAERSLADLLPILRDTGVTPVIACLKAKEVGFEQEVRDAGFDVRLVSGRTLVGKALHLRQLIREVNPHLVYTALFDSDIAGRLAAIGIDVPVVTNLTNTAYDPVRLEDPNIDARKLRAVKLIDAVTARRLTDHFHAVSQAVKDSTVEQLGVDPNRVAVVYRGRDSEQLGTASPERRAAARRELGLADDDLVVVTVGRQEYQKGHRHLIDAVAGLMGQFPTLRLLIAGREGHATPDLKQQIRELEVDHAVTLLGHRKDVPEVLAASDVFAFPSVYEGLGGALIEALALSLPIVASDIPALREVVEEGDNAILATPADSSSLGIALGTLLLDADLRAQLGKKSREIFETRFQAVDASRQLLEFLASVAGRNSQSP